MPQQQAVVKKLVTLLHQNISLKSALEAALQKAKLPGLSTLDEFVDYLNRILIHIPTEKELMPSVREFYFILSQAPYELLKKDEAFNQWMNEFVVSRGDFMDSTAS